MQDEIGGACSMCGVINPKRRGHLENQNIDLDVMSKWILRR